MDLRRDVGAPAQTTMRGHLRGLTALGVLRRHRQGAFPGPVTFELTAPGRDLIAVTEVLGSWLTNAPAQPLALGSAVAKRAVKALLDGWETSMIRALAARPLSLTELDSLISSLSYPSLERRLGAMRLAGQIEANLGGGRSTPYAVTDWLRGAIAPLVAAARWECGNEIGDCAPLSRLDAEASFLLAVPLIRLASPLSGACRLMVEIAGGGGRRLVGVMVRVREGQVLSCVARLEGDSDASVVGPASAWLAALIEHDLDRLELGGDGELAGALVDGLHGALFDPITSGFANGPPRSLP